MNTIRLKNPININGVLVSTISYDTNEITAELYSEADARKKLAAGMKNVTISPAVEVDFGLHLYVGLAAAIAVNPGYTFDDLARVKGTDVLEFADVGRGFLLRLDGSEENNSEEPSDGSAKHTTPASQNSVEKG